MPSGDDQGPTDESVATPREALEESPRLRELAAELLMTAHGGDLDAAIASLRARSGSLPSTTEPGTALPQVARRTPAPPRSGKTLIDVTDLRKTYSVGRQKVQALDGVTLTIDEGEFVALVGSSGSGKSTLLQLMGGLDKPSAGTIRVDGADLGKMRDGKLSEFRGQTIGFVFQFFYLQPFLQVVTNTEVPGMFAHTKRTGRRQRAHALIEQVGLTDRAKHLPREMSGGQMQRAAIARALLNTPKLLLADEPTGNLDSTTGASIIDLFEQIRSESGTTIVMVTHDEEMAARADRVIRIKDGKVVAA